MICPHPHLGEGRRREETREGRVNRVRLMGREWDTTNTSVADYETKRQWTMLATFDGSGRQKMEEEKECAAKRHLPLPRTVQISIACFLHVDDGNVFVVL